MTTENLSRGEKTRARIIQSAHDLFIRQGYHGTSMRQIAKKAGIALGGLYNHFDGKESVFEAVFLAYHPYQEVLPVVLQAQGDTIEHFIRDALERIITALEQRPDFLNLMFIEVVEFKSVHTQDLFALILPQLSQLVERLVQVNRERLRAIPTPMLIRSFFGLFFSYILTETVLASTAPPEFRQDAREHLLDIYLHGILTSASNPGRMEVQR